MNERIKELIKQAGTDVSGKCMNVNNSEKFAEMIVFECIKLAVFKGDAKTGRAIKEHFGVKE